MKAIKGLRKGFTVVELLVVVAVIGILAAFIIVSYSGINAKANVASLQTDLSSSARKLKMYHAEYGVYPQMNASNCPEAPNVDPKYCLKASAGNTLSYCSDAPYKTFILKDTNANNVTYKVTDSSAPQLSSGSTAIFDQGGAITTSGSACGGTRTHTFGTSCTSALPCKIVADASGTITVTIKGSGAGGGGGGTGNSTPGGNGSASIMNNITLSKVYTAFGGTISSGKGDASVPADFTNIAVPIVGGGSFGGSGGYGDWCVNGAWGGRGGQIIGTMLVSTGQVFEITVGAGGAGGYGDSILNDCSEDGNDNGSPGDDGVVIISYSF